MSKEVIPPVPAFNFSPDGPSPFDMIVSGAFAFEVPVTPEQVQPIPIESAPKFSSQLRSSITPILSLEERIAAKRNIPKPQRITRREWLVNQVRENATSITNLNEAAIYAARRQELACGGNDGHGMKNSNLLETNKFLSQSSELKSNNPNEGGVVKCEHEVDEKTCSKCKGHSHTKAA